MIGSLRLVATVTEIPLGETNVAPPQEAKATLEAQSAANTP